MIVILWTMVLIAVGLGGWAFGYVSGKAVIRHQLRAQQKQMREIGKFARQQAAVGDSTGTVVADMIDNLYNDKELN